MITNPNFTTALPQNPHSTPPLPQLYAEKLTHFKLLKQETNHIDTLIDTLNLEIHHQQITNATLRSKIKLLREELGGSENGGRRGEGLGRGEIEGQHETIAVLKVKKEEIEERFRRKQDQNKIVLDRLRSHIEEQQNDSQQINPPNPPQDTSLPTLPLLISRIQTLKASFPLLLSHHQHQLLSLQSLHATKMKLYQKESLSIISEIKQLAAQTESKRREYERELGMLKGEMLARGDFGEMGRGKEGRGVDGEIEGVKEKINAFVVKREDYEKEKVELRGKRDRVREEIREIGVEEFELQKWKLEAEEEDIKSQVQQIHQRIMTLQNQLETIIKTQNTLTHQLLLAEHLHLLHLPTSNEKDEIFKKAIQQLLNRLIKLKMVTGSFLDKQQKHNELQQTHQKLANKYQEIVGSRDSLAKDLEMKRENFRKTLTELKEKQMLLAGGNIEESITPRSHNIALEETKRSVQVSGWRKKAYEIQYIFLITLAGLLLFRHLDSI